MLNGEEVIDLAYIPTELVSDEVVGFLKLVLRAHEIICIRTTVALFLHF